MFWSNSTESVLGWIDYVSQKDIGGLNESRAKRFAREKAYLNRLPEKAFDYRLAEPVKVSREGMVRVRGNWYSVPPCHIGETLSLRINPLTEEAEISKKGILIRSIKALPDTRNRRYLLSEHQVLLKQMWEKQFKSKRKLKLEHTAVNTASLKLDERLFNTSGVAI